MPPPSSRMTKNRAQPTRYRPGRAEVEDQVSEEESSEEEEDQEEQDAQPVSARQPPPPKFTSFPSQKKLAVDLSKAGQQRSTAAEAPRHRKPEEDLEGFVTASESSEDEGEEGSGGEEEESEEESDEETSESEEESSDDEPKKPLLRPTFISKAKRAQIEAKDERPKDDNVEEEERLKQEKTDALLQAHIDRDAAARAAGKKYWDDEEVAPEDEVDDTDGLDPEAEYAAWKLRELKRVRRDRLAIEEKEKEREEIERRRNLTEEERAAEDAEYVAAQKDEQDGRGKMGYMQKYFHKGAFFNDEDADEEVKNALNRDLAGARFTDDTADKSVLPEYMRIRDMTQLGKKGRTKYKDLRSEDTGSWGQFQGKKREFNDGLDDRFRPDDRADGQRERTGANNAPLGERRRRDDDGYSERNDKRPRHD